MSLHIDWISISSSAGSITSFKTEAPQSSEKVFATSSSSTVPSSPRRSRLMPLKMTGSPSCPVIDEPEILSSPLTETGITVTFGVLCGPYAGSGTVVSVTEVSVVSEVSSVSEVVVTAGIIGGTVSGGSLFEQEEKSAGDSSDRASKKANCLEYVTSHLSLK